eukprot:5746900-Pyramimonas_sp.AAC.1
MVSCNSAWPRAGDRVLEVMFAICEGILAGDYPGDTFNFAMCVFLAKGPSAEDSAAGVSRA